MRLAITISMALASYDKVMLDPVTIWRGAESKKKGASQKDIQAMADYF